ncbi:hypothetical protein GOP47_0017853 [Adiantum capillus-veneris]|uniref:Uncharacterized protein n=1 Tax=Adiantum capillus-veneris TaxID=13818 RepID=A0A9D4UG85_ADICA|nr:hypothetical protein GOP47_0017853 [Adiantum capillus-veneris]
MGCERSRLSSFSCGAYIYPFLVYCELLQGIIKLINLVMWSNNNALSSLRGGGIKIFPEVEKGGFGYGSILPTINDSSACSFEGNFSWDCIPWTTINLSVFAALESE